MLAYPSVVAPQPLPSESSSPSHSIHVGTPRVNVEVHTTRHRIAHHNPEKQVRIIFHHLVLPGRVERIFVINFLLMINLLNSSPSRFSNFLYCDMSVWRMATTSTTTPFLAPENYLPVVDN